MGFIKTFSSEMEATHEWAGLYFRGFDAVMEYDEFTTKWTVYIP